MSNATINRVLDCVQALREAEAHIRATAYDFSGGEREHHLQAANRARDALANLKASYAQTELERQP